MDRLRRHRLTADADEVTFGDTKEGSFGLRIAESMRVDRKTGGKIITSEGLEDDKAWGKPAAWVDYYGPVQGETLGIAILNHPSSFRYPTHWHVRTYGLFAANPFGGKDFSGGEIRRAHNQQGRVADAALPRDLPQGRRRKARSQRRSRNMRSDGAGK